MAGTRTMATTLTKTMSGSETEDLVLASLVSIGEQSTASEEIESTTLDSTGGFREFIQGLKDAGSVEVMANNVFDGQATILQALFNAGTTEEWVEAYPNAAGTLTYNAYMSALTFGEATTDGLATVSFTLRLTGAPVYAEA